MDKIKWIIDPVHSEIGFKVKHLMISYVKGSFKSYEATIDGEDFLHSPINVSIDTESIFTQNADRDGHLKSADFFNVENHKKILFEKESLSKVSESLFQLTGLLTIKGISKRIILDVKYGGTNKDPWGNEKLAFSISGQINRKDWGINWNTVLEAGGILIGDEVIIDVEAQFVKQV